MKPLKREGGSPRYSLNLHKSRGLLRAFVENYNEGRPLRERLRTGHVALMGELLNMYRVCLWRVQAPPLAPPRGGGEWVPGERIGGLMPGRPLPYLETNNGQLRHYLKCTARSVQHLRERLKVAGLILEEIWHGSKRNYEVRLNPAVIHLGKAGDKTNYVGLFSGCLLSKNSEGQSANFSPNCTQLKLVTNKLNELEVGNLIQSAGNQNFKSDSLVEKQPVSVEEPSKTVENPANSRSDEELAGYETIEDRLLGTPPRVADSPPEGDPDPSGAGQVMVSGDPDLRYASLGTSVVSGETPDGLELGAGGVGQGTSLGTGKPETFGAAVAHLPEELGRAIFGEVSQIWEVAMKELYEGEWIADSERERAKARLAEYFIWARPERYAAGRKEICERIRLVRKWIDRGRVGDPALTKRVGDPALTKRVGDPALTKRVGDPALTRWVPIPSLFFDYRNPRGFRITKAWYKRHLEQRAIIGDHIALAKAVRVYRQSLKGQAGHSHLRTGMEEIHPTAASAAPGSPVELYQRIVARLARRNEALAAKFQEAILML